MPATQTTALEPGVFLEATARTVRRFNFTRPAVFLTHFFDVCYLLILIPETWGGRVTLVLCSFALLFCPPWLSSDQDRSQAPVNRLTKPGAERPSGKLLHPRTVGDAQS